MSRRRRECRKLVNGVLMDDRETVFFCVWHRRRYPVKKLKTICSIRNGGCRWRYACQARDAFRLRTAAEKKTCGSLGRGPISAARG